MVSFAAEAASKFQTDAARMGALGKSARSWDTRDALTRTIELLVRRQRLAARSSRFRVGDHVSWNSEAGRVSGIIRRKISAPMKFKGYVVHASKERPQYLIESDRTDHLAMHKGSALRKIRGVRKSRSRRVTRNNKH